MTNRRQMLAGLFAMPSLAAHVPPGMGAAQDGLLIGAARARIGRTRYYDPAYVALDYPGGDVPADRGVCTDVVVRAYRDAFGFDLQRAVHRDMAAAFEAYPGIWGLPRPDRNIDHRRVPNLETFLERQGAERRISDGWQPGDLFTGRLRESNLPHIAVVSDRRAWDTGRLKLIHNIGRGTEESDMMPVFVAQRRFRFFPDA